MKLKLFGNVGARVLIVAIPWLLTVVACGPSAETESVCQLSGRWNRASSEIATVLSDLDSSSSSRIRDAVSEVVANLVAFNEVAPRSLKTDIELLLNAYGALDDAFQAIDWQGSVAHQDAAVTSSGVRLASTEIQIAQANLVDFIEENCSVDINNAVNQFPNVGTTLPAPAVQQDNAPEPLATFDNDATVARAFGYVVVERFGVAITDQQADCVGVALLDATSNDASIVDLTYWEMLQSIFNECEVNIDVARALENE